MARGRARESDRWIIRFPPIEGELLSSWLIRLAKEYQQPPILLVQKFSKATIGYLTHPDLILKSDVLKALANAIGISPKRIASASLAGMAVNLGIDLSIRHGKFPWLFKVRGRTEDRKRVLSVPIQYCPQCLREDATPYFRKSWAFAFVVACDSHKCLLAQACPHCGASDYYAGSWLAPTGLQIQSALKNCLVCQGDLARQADQPLQDKYQSIFRFQNALLNGAEIGLIKFGKFEGEAKYLFRWISEFARWLILQNSHIKLNGQLTRAGTSGRYVAREHLRFEDWGPKERIELLHQLAEIFMNWPTTFLEITTKTRLRESFAKQLYSALSDESREILESQRKKPLTRGRKKWTQSDYDSLRLLAEKGRSTEEIASEMNCTVASIRTQASNKQIKIGKKKINN